MGIVNFNNSHWKIYIVDNLADLEDISSPELKEEILKEFSGVNRFSLKVIGIDGRTFYISFKEAKEWLTNNELPTHLMNPIAEDEGVLILLWQIEQFVVFVTKELGLKFPNLEKINLYELSFMLPDEQHGVYKNEDGLYVIYEVREVNFNLQYDGGKAYFISALYPVIKLAIAPIPEGEAK